MIRRILRLFRRKSLEERRIEDLRHDIEVARRKHRPTRHLKREVYDLRHRILAGGPK